MTMLCPSCRAPCQEGAEFCSGCGQRLSSLSSGSLVAGRYEIQKPLGQGGMGTVYKARDRMLGEEVALKVLRTDVAGTPEMSQRFIQEIRLARKVSHKSVCRIHEYGEDGALRYISMAFVDGTDLKRILREHGPFPARQAYDMSIRIAEALQAIHDEGIVHRDLKTPNVMVDGKGIPKLMDFGIAKQWESSATELTGTGMIVGTPEYMSPEQIRAQKVDFRSDIYSLGILVFEIFTGHAPFRADTPVALLMKHLQEPAPLDGIEAADLPRPLVPILRTALAKSPAERFSSAAEMAEALRRARDATALSPTAGAMPLRGAAVPVGKAEPAPTPLPTGVPTAVPTYVPTAVLTPARSAPRVEARGGAARALRLGWWAAGLGGVALTLALTAAYVGVWLFRQATRPMPPSSVPATQTPVTTTTLARAETSRPERTPPTTVAVALQAARPSASATAAAEMPVATMPSPAPPPQQPAPERMGALQVIVVPWGDVTVDGVAVETGPTKRIPLTPGPHLVRVVHPDFQPLQRKLTVKAGETVRLTIDLPEEAIRKGR
jgi:eukaryotic-like serine/threonine-protein kinase